MCSFPTYVFTVRTFYHVDVATAIVTILFFSETSNSYTDMTKKPTESFQPHASKAMAQDRDKHKRLDCYILKNDGGKMLTENCSLHIVSLKTFLLEQGLVTPNSCVKCI